MAPASRPRPPRPRRSDLLRPCGAAAPHAAFDLTKGFAMSCCFLEPLIGPRVPLEELRRNRLRYATPTVLLALARVLLLVSLFLPYWSMDMDAPQYPDGLYVTAYVNHLEGDVKEINALNHYIGMKPLEQAAQHERALSVWLIVGMFLLIECASFVHSKWAVQIGRAHV